MNDVVKKTSRKTKIAVIAGAVILAGSIAAVAGGKAAWRHGAHMEHMIEHVSEDLNLDSAQTAQLEALGNTLLEVKKGMRDGNELQSVIASIQGQTLDQTALNALVDSKVNHVREQAPVVITAMANFYDGLNAEQQKEARAKIEKLANRIKSHRHGHDYD